MPPPFSALDILRDAVRSFARAFFAHVRWNLAFMGVVFGATVLAMLAAAFTLAVSRTGTEAVTPWVSVPLSLSFVILAVALLALHQASTLAVARAERRDGTLSAMVALGEALPRVIPVSIALAARIALDVVPVCVVWFALVALVIEAGLDDDGGPTLVLTWLAVTAGWPGWSLVVRASLGVSGPCIVHEGLGPIAALRRSHTLLSGHRWKVIVARLAWAPVALVVCGLGYVPALVGAATRALGGGLDAVGGLCVFGGTLSFYLIALMALSFDSVLEDALYARVTRPRPREELAAVFE